MDFKNLAASLLKDKLDPNIDTSNATEALEGLMGGGGLSDLVGKFTNSGLAEQAKSWLGDGENVEVSADQIKEVLDADQINGFAEKLGLNEGGATEALSNLLPGLVDKASSGGNLLDNIGGLGGLAGMAKKFF